MMFNQRRQPGPRTHAHPQFYPSANGAPRHLQPGPQVQQIRMNHQQLSTLNMAAGLPYGLPGTNKGPQVTHIPVPQIPVNFGGAGARQHLPNPGGFPSASTFLFNPTPRFPQQYALYPPQNVIYENQIKAQAMKATPQKAISETASQAAPVPSSPKNVPWQRNRLAIIDPETGRNVLDVESDNAAQRGNSTTDGAASILPSEMQQSLRDSHSRETPISEGEVVKMNEGNDVPAQFAIQVLQTALGFRPVDHEKHGTEAGRNVVTSTIYKGVVETPTPSSPPPHAVMPPASEREDAEMACHSCRERIAGVCYMCVECVDYMICSTCEADGVLHTGHNILRLTTSVSPLFHPVSGDVHQNVECATCHGPIRGSRYKCLQCPEIDLCHTCKTRGTEHSDHLFIRLPSRIPVVHLTPDLDATTGESLATEEHPGVMCDSCHQGVRGRRFKCLVCPEFNLCSDCEQLEEQHSHHPMIRFSKPSAIVLRRSVILADGLHHGVTCTECEGRIRGYRYKCLKCRDYDLCTRCEAASKHLQHRMLRMPPKCESQVPVPSDQLTPSQEDSAPRMTAAGRAPYLCPCGETCLGKPRYVCLQCPSYGHCPQCEARKTHKEHTMLRVPEPAFAIKYVLGLTCDECGNAISDLRYRCLTCPDFHLCPACEERKVHGIHPMLRLSSRTNSTAAEMNQPSSAPLVRDRVLCTGCKCPIVGFRYECVSCQTVNLCGKCEGNDKTHLEHRLLRFPTYVRQRYAKWTCGVCGGAQKQGARYKCLVCPDSNLCFLCAARQNHIRHPMMRLPFSRKPSRRRRRHAAGRPLSPPSPSGRCQPPLAVGSPSGGILGGPRGSQNTATLACGTTGKPKDDDENLCKLCLEAELSCVFAECGHMVACLPCAEKVSHCPVCRKAIANRIRFFKV
ncbi:unnamed protein product [Darwinula stevensoni]|uniref:Uncharacterized protein n=1 Tax=Darwinula stevensoni TaxID=69355 RepID=A0A7R9A3P0_9CRUS|nr:unnamed protein product [Darwinula stevensoni]CAG0888363.1 unnamed protein product [Darwinula stevensoni]